MSRRRWAVASAVLVLLTACDSGDGRVEPASIRGIPVVPDAVEGPKTRLADGFSVAEGSLLLGTTFPWRASSTAIDGQRAQSRGWLAVLLVTGDPRKVVHAYRAQAEAIGIPTSLNCFLGSSDRLTCDGSGRQGQVAFALLFTRIRTTPPSSHLLLRYEEAVRAPPLPLLPELPRSNLEPAESIKLPNDWAPLPKVGERFGAGFIAPVLSDSPGLRLVARSELVAPPGSSTCGSGGFVAVLRVDGDPRRIVQQYAQQLAGVGFHGDIQEKSFDGVKTLRAGSDESGAGLYLVEAVVRSGSPTYLRVERCVD